RKTAFMCQNSGLGNAVNPITSLSFPFRIPTLMVITWRAGPGLSDEPQHELMGRITPDLLNLMEVPHQAFPTDEKDVESAISEADRVMEETGLPFAFIMQKGDVRNDGKGEMTAPAARVGGEIADHLGGQRPTRFATLERLLEGVSDEAAIIATTGKCGRELFTIADRPQHLYQVGSMGCAAGMGLGVALNSDKPVVVVDGDGAALMKMGTLATIGAYRPNNLIHIVLDNGTYDSTGGQPTVSACTDFAAIAAGCEYARSFRCDSLTGFGQALQDASASAGPQMIHMRILPGSMDNLGRPTISPADVARRFRDFLVP
ncbi:MAG: phosphonopyruvate decarboxylase, partial [Rhodospirillales bacterium]